MEEKRTVFGYLTQVFVIFGFVMLIMNAFCLLFGESAKEFSAMFALGGQGVPAGISFQLLGVAVLIVVVRFLFFTDTFFKKMSIGARTVGMLGAVIAIIAGFVVAFDWFPANQWQPWVMFLLCFGISFLGSYFVASAREREENRRMEEALRRLQQKEGKAE